jgi:hypothetical protein
VPFASPVTVAVVAVPVADAVCPPGAAVTVYPVIALPPFDTGAVQLTVACAAPAVAVTAVGGPGGADGVTALDAVEAPPVPAAVAALTVKV